MQMPDVTFFSP